MDNGESSYRRFLEGDDDGLAEIIRDYRDGLILYLCGITGDFAAAEEAAEDTFVKLGVKRPRFRGNGEYQRSGRSCDDELQANECRDRHRGHPRYRTWLYTIGRNCAIDLMRRRSRDRTVPIDECGEVTDDEACLEQSYIREERRITLHRVLRRLKPDHRQVLWLMYFEELSAKDAARIMKKSVHAVETLVYRARLSLKTELKRRALFMKSCDEMTADVLRRIGEERTAMKKKRKLAITGVSVICVCLAVIICIGVLPGSENPAVLVQAADLMDGITAEAVDGKAADNAFKQNQMRLAVELFKRTSAESEGENLLISPLSIQLALAMTANGAAGNTLTEMEQVLGGEIPLDALNEYLHTYANSLPSEEKAKLEIANSIWFRDTFAVRQDFLQTNADYYGASAYRSPFDMQTVRDINNWVDKNTDGMIDEIIQEIDPQDMMFLINAIVFDGTWEVTYSEDDVRDSTFYAYSGEEQDAELMYSEESLYLDGGSAKGFMKPYAGGKYSFAALLPDMGTDIYDYIAGLTPEGLREALNNAESAEVHTHLPKFSYDYELSMNGILSEMGMPTAFNESMADFSGVGDGGDGLFISSVLHKTFITVDENGTKAAAVTSVTLATESVTPSYTVRLDRPFVYMIVDTETSLPIFMGAVTDIG